MSDKENVDKKGEDADEAPLTEEELNLISDYGNRKDLPLVI